MVEGVLCFLSMQVLGERKAAYTQACVWGSRVKNLDYLLNPLERLFSLLFSFCV